MYVVQIHCVRDSIQEYEHHDGKVGSTGCNDFKIVRTFSGSTVILYNRPVSIYNIYIILLFQVIEECGSIKEAM